MTEMIITTIIIEGIGIEVMKTALRAAVILALSRLILGEEMMTVYLMFEDLKAGRIKKTDRIVTRLWTKIKTGK